MQSENISNMFLVGSMVMASIDYVGLLDYLIKAVMGGGVWFLFKLLQDYFSPFIRKRAEKKLKQKHEQEEREKAKLN